MTSDLDSEIVFGPIRDTGGSELWISRDGSLHHLNIKEVLVTAEFVDAAFVTAEFELTDAQAAALVEALSL